MMTKILPVFLLLAAAGSPHADEIQAVLQPVPSPPAPFVLETIPPRPAGALSGSEFAGRTGGMRGIERQRVAVGEILRGNVPDFLREMKPVRLTRDLASGQTLEAVVWVTPDYVSVGSRQDFLRMPLTHPSATAVANQFGCVLPTTRIVDAVYQQAKYHLVPDTLPPGPKMRSSEYYLRHRKLIERQRAGIPLGELISGHKKDVVLTGRLTLKPDRIAIYGWHRRPDDPIQPLSTVHGARYADYSHGVRLVWSTVLVGGEARSIYEVLRDPELAAVLSDEGEIPGAWQVMHPSLKTPPAKVPKKLVRG